VDNRKGEGELHHIDRSSVPGDGPEDREEDAGEVDEANGGILYCWSIPLFIRKVDPM
jgi:hypothetical protein